MPCLEQGARRANKILQITEGVRPRAQLREQRLGDRRHHRAEQGADNAKNVGHRGQIAAGDIGIAFGRLPRLLVLNELVGLFTQLHNGANSMPGVETSERLARFAHRQRSLREQRRVARFAHLAIELAFEHGERAIAEVAQIVDQIRVNLESEFIERQVDILWAATQVGRVKKSQISRIKKVQVLTSVNEGAARLRHLLAVDREHAVNRELRRQPESGALQHRRPEQGMEINNVLSNKMDNARV